MKSQARYAPYSKETALCVDLAYHAVEDDLLAEIAAANGSGRDALERLLKKLRDRRQVLEQFTKIAVPGA